MRGLEEIFAVLRRWPRLVMPDYRALALESVVEVRTLFDADRVMLAFSEGDEPWLTIVEADQTGSRWHEDEEADYALVDESLTGATFFAAVGQKAVVAPEGARSAVSAPFSRAIRAAVGDVNVLSIPVESDDAQGRLFVCAPRAAEEVLLRAGDVLAALISMRFEATGHTALAVRDAVADDRVRVARDLHDGLLQSFTGVVLQLETIHSMLDGNPEVRRMITKAQSILMSDQRELRRFVEQLRPRPLRREVPYDFAARLDDLRLRFETQWSMRVDFEMNQLEPLVGAFLGQETFRLIHEAVTNAAKHGGASAVRVAIRTSGSEMRIEVADNGSGFPFHGRLTLEHMRASGGGPAVLAERVHALNGDLVVDSTDSGSVVTISVPLGWGGSADGDHAHTR